MVTTIIATPHVALLIINLFIIFGWIHKNDNGPKVLLCAFSVCYFTLLYMFSEKSGDHLLYKDYFINDGLVYNANFEPAWRVFNDFVYNYISRSYEYFIILVYFLTTLCKWIAAKLVGGNIYLTFVLAIVLLFHVDFEQIRQGLVLSLSLVSLGLFFKQRFLYFTVIASVCVMLHYGMIGFFLPMIGALIAKHLFGRGSDKWYLIVATTLLLCSFFVPVLELVMSTLPKEIFFYQKLYAYFMSEKFSYSTFSTTRVFFMIICVIFLFYRRQFNTRGGVNLVFLTDFFVFAVIQAQIFSDIGVVATRVYFVFCMGLLCLILPMLLECLKDFRKSIFFLIIAFLPNFFLYTFLRSALKYI